MATEMVMIGMSILVLVGILLHHPSRTLGIPSLLIFMGVGLMLGNGEFNFVYDDLDKTAWIGGLALNMIVFVGGTNTSTDKIKVAYKEGGVLASFGVLFTTLFFAVILYWLLDFNFVTCLLFAAIVSSTDPCCRRRTWLAGYCAYGVLYCLVLGIYPRRGNCSTGE